MSGTPKETLPAPRPINPPPAWAPWTHPNLVGLPTSCFPWIPPPTCLYLSLLEKPNTATCVGDRLRQPSPTQGVFLGPRLWLEAEEQA